MLIQNEFEKKQIEIREKSGISIWIREKRNILIPVCIFLMGLLVLLFIYITVVKPQSQELSMQALLSGDHIIPSQTVENEQVIAQDFFSDEEILQIGLQVATYDSELENITLQGTLLEYETDVVLSSIHEEYTIIEDNSFILLDFGGPFQKEGGHYKIQFSVEGLGSDQALAFWMSDRIEIPASVDGVSQEKGLVLGFYGPSDFLPGYFWAFSIPLAAFFSVLWVMLFVLKTRPQNIFLFSAIVLGVIYTFVLPPYSTLDENVHIPLVLSRSEALLGKEVNFNEGFYSWDKRGEDEITGLVVTPPGKSQYNHIYQNFFSKEQNAEKTVRSWAPKLGQRYQYWPQVAGVTLARLLKFGQVPTLYMGRFFALAAYIAILYFTIKLVPFKTLFCIAGLVPFALCAAGSYSYDTSITALCFLFTGYVFYICYTKEKMTVFDMGFLLILGILIAPLKYVYFPIVLLLLIIPKEKWPGPKWKKIFTTTIFVGGILIVLYLAGSAILLEFKMEKGSTPWNDEGGSYTYRLLFTNFTEAIRLVVVSALDGLTSIVMGGGAMQYHPLPVWLNVATWVLLILSVFPSTQQSPLLVQAWQKGIMGGLALMVYALTFIGALSWTPIGDYYIKGVQGRYFIPIFPILALLLYGTMTRKKETDNQLIYGACLVNGYAILYVFQGIVMGRTLEQVSGI